MFSRKCRLAILIALLSGKRRNIDYFNGAGTTAQLDAVQFYNFTARKMKNIQMAAEQAWNTCMKERIDKLLRKMAFSNNNALGKGVSRKRVDRNSVEAWSHQSDRQAAYILDPPIVAFAGFLLVGLEICMQR